MQRSVEVIFLGTGSGRPDPDRATSAILVGAGDEAVLIDAGEGVGRALVQYAPEWVDRVSAVILTHNHADHIAGLPMLFMLWKARGRNLPLDVWMPTGVGRPLFTFLDSIRMGEQRRGWMCFLHRLKERTCHPVEGFSMETWLNGHLPVEEEGRFGSFSLALEVAGKRIVHSSDIPSMEPLEGRINGADLFISESMHIDPAKAVALGQEEGAKRIVLTHIPPGHPCEPIEGVVWAHDGYKLILQDDTF